MQAPGGGERIYSVSQLSEALSSGLMGLKDQLQVLSILDGSSSCWPGVSAASSDLEQLVKLAGQHLAELEKQSQQLAGANTKLQEQNTQLNSKLKGEPGRDNAAQSCCWPESNTPVPCDAAAASTAAKQQAQEELRSSQTQVSSLQSKLETAQEAAKHAEQQVWQLEQSNSQLAQQAAKQAADADFLEGELAGLRENEMRLREQVAVQQEQVRSR